MTRKVQTPFGSMYVHVEIDADGKLCGGAISDPRKERDAQVALLIETLSDGLDDALASVGRGGLDNRAAVRT